MPHPPGLGRENTKAFTAPWKHNKTSPLPISKILGAKKGQRTFNWMLTLCDSYSTN